MAGQTITIVCEDDGSYTVTIDESPEHQQAEMAAGMGQDDDGPKSVRSVEEVLAIVQEELSEPRADDQAAWAEEAAERDEQGYRRPGAGPMMSMGA